MVKELFPLENLREIPYLPETAFTKVSGVYGKKSGFYNFAFPSTSERRKYFWILLPALTASLP